MVFWDFDDTLASRDGRWSGAVVEAIAQVDPSCVVDAGRLRHQLRTSFPWHRPDVVSAPVSSARWWDRLTPTIVSACQSVGVPLRTAYAAAAALPGIYYRVDAWSLAAQAVSALGKVREVGFGCVIVSNHAPELPQLVRNLGLEPWIDATVVSAAVGAEKPHPMIFRRAIAVSDADPARSWMVGDNPIADVSGARAIGLRAILVARPTGTNRDGIGLLAAAEQIVHGR